MPLHRSYLAVLGLFALVTASGAASNASIDTASQGPDRALMTDAAVGGEAAAMLNYSVVMGTISVMLVGSLASGLYMLGKYVVDYVSRTFVLTVTLTNQDEAFEWVLDWLSTQETKFISAQKLTVSLKHDKRRKWYLNDHGDRKAKIKFLPGSGLHMFRYQGRVVWMTRNVEGNPMTTGFNHRPFSLQRITLSTFGRDQSFFAALFQEAMDAFTSPDTGKTKIYAVSRWGDDWDHVLSRQPRSFESVILNKSIATDILDDCRWFLANRAWYEQRGTPYRRGYLLHGPPGTGKTSFCSALASELGLNIAVLSLSNESMHDRSLNNAMHLVPEGSIILMEDVDAVFVDRSTAQDAKHRQGVSFSGLLNAIDGVASQEGKLLFMSTNHIERLDPALIRPGRCDVKVKLDYASRAQIRGMFLNFFPGEAALADDFSDVVPAGVLSMAQLQGHFLHYRDDPLGAFDDHEHLVRDAVEGASNAEEVDVSAWLDRLALPMYREAMVDLGFNVVGDMKGLDPNELCDRCEITHIGHRRRIASMLAGEEQAKLGYALANKAEARKAFVKFFPREKDSDLAADFVGTWVPSTRSTFQTEQFLICCETAGEAVALLPRFLDEAISFEIHDPVVAIGSVDAWLDRMGIAPPEPVALPTVDDWIESFGDRSVPPAFADKLAENAVDDMAMIVDKFDDAMLKEYGIEGDGLRWRMAASLENLKKAVAAAADIPSAFAKDGYVELEQILGLDDGALKDLGVADRRLRHAMVKRLADLKKEREKKRVAIIWEGDAGSGSPH